MSHSNAEIKTQSTKIFVQSMLVVLEIQLIVRCSKLFQDANNVSNCQLFIDPVTIL